jgi:Cd2+/Zn2+-exporting ATPase
MGGGVVTQARYRVTGMDCGACAAKIDTALRRTPGVSEVAVSFQSGVLSIAYDDRVDEAVLAKTLSKLGFGATVLAPGADRISRASTPPWWKSTKAKATILCGLAIAIAYGLGRLFPEAERYAFIAALLIGLVPVARRALAGALMGSPFSIEMLMTVAAVGAVIIGATQEAAAVVLFFLVGEMLEGLAASRARRSISELADLVPKSALVEAAGDTRVVPAELLKWARSSWSGLENGSQPTEILLKVRAILMRRRLPGKACRRRRSPVMRCSPAR